MGFLRSGALVIVCVLFLISCFFMSSVLVLRNSVSYENINVGLSSYVNSVIEETSFESDLNETFSKMQVYCENNSEYVFIEEHIGEVFDIDCGIVEQGQKVFREKLLGDLLHKVYYENYECGFWDCFRKTGSFFFLFSQKAYDYWNRWFYSFLVISIVFFLFAFLFAKNKSNAFVISGILLAISVIHLLFFSKIMSKVRYLRDVYFLLVDSMSVFWMFILIAFLLLAFGFLMKIFSIGFKISDFFNKFDKGDKKKKDLPNEDSGDKKSKDKKS